MTSKIHDQQVWTFIDSHKWYAPIDLGNGIMTRPSDWPDAPPDTPHMGTARFNYILARNLPDLQGKRILDIGCNAGIISLHMARLGAREVVGIDSERTWKSWREQAQFVKDVLEQRCATTYNTRYIDADMRDLPSLDLGSFDVALALCCFYYIPEADMCRLTRHLADKTPLFLVQGNTIRNDHRGFPEVKRRAHPRFIRRVLRENGFPYVTIDAPWRYGRPVIVGHRDDPGPRYRNRLAAVLAATLRKMSFFPWLIENRLRAKRTSRLSGKP